MVAENEPRDAWRFPLLFLWLLYLLLGVQPEFLFYALREAGHVTTQRAFVNSHWLVYTAWVLFLAWFIARRGLRLGMPLQDAVGRGLRVLILAGIAFYPIGLRDALQISQVPDPGLRNLLLVSAIAKVVAFALLVLIVAYYCLATPRPLPPEPPRVP